MVSCRKLKATIMITTELLTSKDLQNLKNEIVSEIKELLNLSEHQLDWIKSPEVKKMLDCSEGTLVNLRASGLLPCSKINGTFYYRKTDLNNLLNSKRVV